MAVTVPAAEAPHTFSRRVVRVPAGPPADFRKLPDSSLIARGLAPYRLILCAAPSYLAGRPPIRVPADLGACDCLSFAYTSMRTHWSFSGPDGRETVAISGSFMADHGEPLLSAGLAGLGVLLLPLKVVEPALSDGRLVELLPGYRAASPPMHLLYGPDRRLTPKLRSFIDFAVARFGSPHH